MVNACLTGGVTPHGHTPPAELTIAEPAQVLALAYAPKSSKQLFASFFLLDQKLGRIVRTAKEPVLAQMRFAWWREQIAILGEASQPDPLLQMLGSAWVEEEASLLELIDGWEELLGHTIRSPADWQATLEKHAVPYLAIASRTAASMSTDAVRSASLLIAAANLFAHSANENERHTLRDYVAEHRSPPVHFPRALRPLAILYTLSERMLERGGSQLLERPGDLLAAIRAGFRGH